MATPKIIDDDEGTSTAETPTGIVRSWFYEDRREQCLKMRLAREFAEGWFQAEKAEQTATARLIKAAPKLLEALKAMLAAQSARRHPLGSPDEGIATVCAVAAAEARDAIAEARDAIAEATGSAYIP